MSSATPVYSIYSPAFAEIELTKAERVAGLVQRHDVVYNKADGVIFKSHAIATAAQFADKKSRAHHCEAFGDSKRRGPLYPNNLIYIAYRNRKGINPDLGLIMEWMNLTPAEIRKIEEKVAELQATRPAAGPAASSRLAGYSA